MSYWSDETARIEDGIRKALAAKDISEVKRLLRRRNAHRVPTTAEWISDGLLPLGSMFRQMVRGGDDEGLKDEFWMTLEEAQHMLACVDLATLPAWDAGALLEALTLSWDEHTQLTRSGMSKQQVERRISLAQASGQLGPWFRAKDGLEWANRMGIEFPDRVLVEAIEKIAPHFDGSFEERWQAWCAAKEEKAEERSSSQQPRIKLREQEDAIIDWLNANGFTPKALPYVKNGLPTARAAARKALDKRYPFDKKTAFDTAWQRLRGNEEIGGGTE